ncbi:BZ3500_MvSof-1268-A1-R1_Chr4-2g06974 [Microbotryum saponariae]|uniref:BZ3500_MvSof-1268-A1-R1_Chr4-2g06974 protein n=1 Tax=Microbotryum saponariae TaxID=289078 RepID=A0A2X0LL32_9BASI|nr:BZ3500_MvSof-1268-A1-R1_Chr4-2g06974 [Microbotryum saponariae]SDA06639.1 BZ3501_MvSof-1269-A2-R1_Chr4-2g06685 [Microbotryum saponariae]
MPARGEDLGPLLDRDADARNSVTPPQLGLLLWWIVDDNSKQYMIDEATVVFISDVGAAHKGLFIPGTALTFVFFSATLLTERWFRHIRRIPGALKKKETVYDIVCCVFGILGGLALMLLSIFDAFNHSTAHWTLTLVFVVCIALSAIFQTLEVMSLERDHVDRNHLRRNAIIKLVIVSVAVAGAIGFGVTYGICAGANNDVAPTSRCNVVQSAAASLEWFIAFLFFLYICTFILDLLPARKTEGHKFHPGLIEADKSNVLHEHKDGRPGAPGGLDSPVRRASEDDHSLGPRVGRTSGDQGLQQV